VDRGAGGHYYANCPRNHLFILLQFIKVPKKPPKSRARGGMSFQSILSTNQEEAIDAVSESLKNSSFS